MCRNSGACPRKEALAGIVGLYVLAAEVAKKIFCRYSDRQTQVIGNIN